MSQLRLHELGMTVREVDGVDIADLEVSAGLLVNPITGEAIQRVSFATSTDRLTVLEPPTLVGIPPLLLARIARTEDLEQILSDALQDIAQQLERRSAELSALGIDPVIEPDKLRLTAMVATGEARFLLALNRQGRFYVVQAARGGDSLTTTHPQSFELTEFRDRAALEGYLLALFGDHESASRRTQGETPARSLIRFAEIASKFGPHAVVPPRSSLEVLLLLRVKGEEYRFAAARLTGRTFRGMIAGARGKLWVDRFTLDDFPGVPALMAKLLNVSPGDVEWIE